MNDVQAELGAAFNPAEYEHAGDNDFAPLTPGWYPAEIEKAGVAKTKDETGSYLKVQFTVLGDKYNGRKVFTNINLKNKSSDAENIGRRELATLCSVVGIPGLQSSQQLIGQILQIRTAVQAAKGDYPAGTVVKGYKAAGAVAQPPASATGAGMANVQPAPQSAPKATTKAVSGGMPWDK